MSLSSLNPQMFAGSHDFTIEGGIFNINTSLEKGETGLLELFRHSSSSALFDAEARFPPPKCHPGTRQRILKDLKGWVHSDPYSPDSAVRWLYGPAGAGKSAIAQSLTESVAQDKNLAAAFFFWRSDPSRNNAHQLFTTISSQLVTAIPELRSIINQVVCEKPAILTSSIESQFDSLILKPCLQAIQAPNSSLTSRVRILIIDGLDECSDSNTQQRILFILAKAMQEYTLPFRLLISSRPEPRIKEAFSSFYFKSICCWVPLDDTYEASLDIRKLFQDRFREILHCHSSTMEHIARPWPSSDQIETLVSKASGQFIYPAVVLKYINDDGAVPAERLNIILGLQRAEMEDGEATSPFAELDALYQHILSTSKNTTRLRRILGALIVWKGEVQLLPLEYNTWHNDLAAQQFTNLLCIPIGTVRAALSACHSLFQNPSPDESGFKFAHASFEDFLCDPHRSLHFYIDKPTWHIHLAQCCLDICAKEHYLPLISAPSEPDNFPARYDLCRYVCSQWIYHWRKGKYDRSNEELLSKLQSVDVYAASTRVWEEFIGQQLKYEWQGLWEYVHFMRDLFHLRDYFLPCSTVGNHQLETRTKLYLKNIWDITTIGFCMRFLDNEGRESFNIPVLLKLLPPYGWDRDILVATIQDRFLLVGDRPYKSMKVTPLETQV
ncbi:hypothetical protein GYMLUDRAFT_33745 [Collybiopsis luxurians FD-317 M1]|nr:hypothetical protein GYMLUDRAFT_33745 [Collybiopsis luxurians FD-317 M1]